MKSFGDMVKHAQKLQKQMKDLQDKFKDDRYQASAGGGIVTAIVDGKQILVELKISPAAIKDGDMELLEDLIVTAIGEAQRNSEEQMNESLKKISGGFGPLF